MREPLNKQPSLTDIMPTMLKHEGVWEGVYSHLDPNGSLIDRHNSHIICEFPENGAYDYIQYNHFTWADGREKRVQLPGVLRDGKLWWDTETFHGCAWQSEFDLILLNIDRKDEPGANFFELIALSDTGKHRSRTWHWFRDGKLYKRTLCEETRISHQVPIQK